MFELRPTFDLAEFTLASTSGWLTLALLLVLLRVNARATVPALVAAADALAVMRGRQVPRLDINFAVAAITWPLALGSALGLFYFIDRDNFLWYVQDALTLWPDYGSLTCWAVNAVLALFVGGLITLFVAMVRIYHAAGVLAGVGFVALALGAFFAGLLFGPVGILFIFLALRGELRSQAARVWHWAWGP